MGRWFYIALGIHLFLYGILAVTNIKIEWAPQLLGFSALVAGVIALVCGISWWVRGREMP